MKVETDRKIYDDMFALGHERAVRLGSAQEESRGEPTEVAELAHHARSGMHTATTRLP